VPEGLVKWILSFCTNRTGSVGVGSYTSQMERIQHAGIPQGSPLSPILYVFYNANLVEGRMSKDQGSLGFIDDFTAWVTALDTQAATEMLQRQVIPKAEKWSRESGATFEADKTGLVHFTRPRDTRANTGEAQGGLHFMGTSIKPQDRVKILGVVLDHNLKMSAHLDKVILAATRKCLAISRLRGIRQA
jgi:hypothetical protein